MKQNEALRAALLRECRTELAALEADLARREAERSRRGYTMSEALSIEVLRSRLARARDTLRNLEDES